MGLSERLKAIREISGKDQKGMADQLGISFRSWQDYELGKSIPGGKVFEALVKLGFNANWLLTGQGGMKQVENAKPLYKQLLDGEVPIVGEVGQPFDKELDQQQEGFVKIPRYKVVASAGNGTMIHSEQIVDHLAFRSDWVRHALGVPVASLALINVTGDSMEPTLSNGDLILIDTSVSKVEDSGVYVLRYDGILKVKRIHSKYDGSVVIISDNAKYSPELIQGDLINDLYVVGRVVWCGRRM